MRPKILVMIVAAGWFVSACANTGDGRSASPTVDDANVITSGIAEPSDRQLEMISDGKVSFVEYEEAYLAYIQCAVDEGFKLRGEPQLDVHGKYYKTTLSGGPAADYEANNLSLQACEDRHLLSVLRLWDAANRPSESVLQEANQAVVDCLNEQSITMPAHLTIDEFAMLLQAAASGEPGGIPAHLSISDIEPVLAQGADPSLLFGAFLACRKEVAQQFPVGW